MCAKYENQERKCEHGEIICEFREIIVRIGEIMCEIGEITLRLRLILARIGEIPNQTSVELEWNEVRSLISCNSKLEHVNMMIEHQQDSAM